MFPPSTSPATLLFLSPSLKWQMALAHLSSTYLSIIPLSFSLDSSFDLLLLVSLPVFLILLPVPLLLPCSLSFRHPLSAFLLPSLPHFRLLSDPRHSLSLSLPLFLPSRKSLSTICLAVMNSEPFRTNQLGQINETLQGDKLCVCVCKRVLLWESECVHLKCLIIRCAHHLIYPAVTDSVLQGNTTDKAGCTHSVS